MNRKNRDRVVNHIRNFAVVMVAVLGGHTAAAASTSSLPISDAHLHYSHDSVELTPPERVIEIMREANLKLASMANSKLSPKCSTLDRLVLTDCLPYSALP